MIVGQQTSKDIGNTVSSSGHFPCGPCAVMEWVSKKFSVITRSSFCAELRNQLEAAQSSILLATFLEESSAPFSSALQLMKLRD